MFRTDFCTVKYSTVISRSPFKLLALNLLWVMMSQRGKHIFWKDPCMNYLVTWRTAEKSAITKYKVCLWTFIFEFMKNAIHCLFSLAALLQRSLTCYVLEKNTRASGKKKRCQTFIRFVPKLKKLKYLLEKKSGGKNKTTQGNLRWNKDKLVVLEELTGAECRSTQFCDWRLKTV